MTGRPERDGTAGLVPVADVVAELHAGPSALTSADRTWLAERFGELHERLDAQQQLLSLAVRLLDQLCEPDGPPCAS